MSADQFRVSIYLPKSAESVVRSIAAKRGVGVNDVFRIALGILLAHEDAREAGQYVGTTRVREHLEQIIVTPL